MRKPKMLLALKEMYRKWPTVISYPMLMAGLELILKSCWRNQGIKNNYKISVMSIHEEIDQIIDKTDYPKKYRFGHNQVSNDLRGGNREEVLAIGLYNALKMGKTSNKLNDSINGLGNLSIIDYQIPVCRRGRDIGCMDMLGIVSDKNEHRPVLIELKGQADDNEKNRRDCPHFALLEAWIYFIPFLKNLSEYKEQVSKQKLFQNFDFNLVKWEEPIISIVAPEAYWKYWERSDKERGYTGLKQFCECCALMGYIYSNEADLELVSSLEVIGLSLENVNSNISSTSKRTEVEVSFDRINKISTDYDKTGLKNILNSPVTIQCI